MPYQKHDKDNVIVNPGTLLDRNAYERYDVDNVIESPQPSNEVEDTDYGDQYKDWDADYSKHGINGEDLNPDVPIELVTGSVIVPPAGFPTGSSRVQEDLTGTLATFTGGVGALTVEGVFACKPAQSNLRDALDGWNLCTDWSTTATQTYTPDASEANMEFAFVTRATDTEGTLFVDIADVIVHVYPLVTVTTQATYTGIKKVGRTLDVYNATGQGGIPPLNYLVQIRWSTTGTGGWSDNSNIGANLDPGEQIQYTIPDERAGQYLQIRSRIRDNNGQGGSSVYQQIWSIAPDSSLQIADYLSEGSGFGVALSGEFRVGQQVAVASIPAFQGGAPTVKYEYQWQKSQDGTNWVGFDSPWTEYDPTTILIDNPIKTLNSPEEGYFIRVQARATDKAGQQLIVAGEQYGPIAPEEPVVFLPVGVIAPLGLLDGAYRVDDVINITPATFVGGAEPYVSEVTSLKLHDGTVIQSWTGAELDGPIIYRLNHLNEGQYVYVSSEVIDSEGHITNSNVYLYDYSNFAGAVLPFEPALELLSSTEVYGYATPGNTLSVRCGEYSGGIAPQVYDVLLRQSDTLGGVYTQTTIQANATPGQLYNVPITTSHLNKYLTFATSVVDNNRDDATGFKQKFDIRQLEYKVITPSIPTPSGPKYDENGYDFDMYVEPNYKQGHILRVGDTLTLTVPEFFGGEAPYRYDLNTWTILNKVDGVEVFASPANQPPGSSVTYTIPQSLQGKYLKVNYYFYDRLLTRFKFEAKLYDSTNLGPTTGIIQPAL